jgi:hypothetical protein
MRLYEANMEAKKQSKLSHELAKKYYDRKTREISLKRGDLVYLYNPIAKMGRAKKFEYKYQGPYMILEKISPLIYKLQMEEGKSIVVHVNRLKRAKVGQEANRKILEMKKLKKYGKKQSPRQSEPRLSEMIEESREEEVEIPPIQIREVEDEESSAVSPTVEDQQHPEWTPETRYLRRKIVHENKKSFGGTNDSPYALRSKSARTQFQEHRNESDRVTLQTPGSPARSRADTSNSER